jgi:hypothetical protein
MAGVWTLLPVLPFESAVLPAELSALFELHPASDKLTAIKMTDVIFHNLNKCFPS